MNPNLFGLDRSEVSPRTWWLGRLLQWLLMLWLAAGLAIMLPMKLWPALAPGMGLAVAWWFASLILLIAPGLAFHLSLLLDGWPRRGWAWRAGAIAMVLVSIGMAVAWTALVLWYLGHARA